MNNFDINKLDFNLIKAFDALMRTRSVTKAATALNIGQPAMSHALSRLRTAFDDELFVRTPDGMQPTKRADEIIIPIRRALTELKLALQSETSFNPQKEIFQLTLGLSDYCESVLLPQLLQDFAVSAPNLSFKVRQIELHKVPKLIDNNEIDLAVGYIRDNSSWHQQETLFTDYRQCIYSKRLMGIEPPISLEDYIAQRHVLRSVGGEDSSIVDRALAKLGQRRNIALIAPRFSTLPLILTRSALIVTLPTRLAAIYASQDDLVASDLPFDVPMFKVSMVWHKAADQDPALNWLRCKIRHAASMNSQTTTG